MPEFRTKKTYNRYKKYIASGAMDHVCRLCEKKALKEFKYWKILKNDFPWDLIATKHDILVPKKHATEEKLSLLEIKEFKKIKKNFIEKNYSTIAESTKKHKSIPKHFHVHLILVKK